MIRSVSLSCVYILLFLFSSSEALAQTTTNTNSFSQFKRVGTISGFLNLFKFEEGRVRSLFLTDSTLVVWNGDGVENYFFSQYSLKKNALIRKIVKSGRHRGEGLQILSAGMLDDRTIWYYDLGLKKAVVLELSDIKNTRDNILITEYALPGKIYYSAQLLGKSRFLGSGSVDTGYVRVSSMLQEIKLETNKQIREYGKMPESPSNTPFNSWRNANEGFLYTNPSRNKAVLAKHYTDEIEIFDLLNRKTIKVKGPENLTLEFNSFSLPKLDVAAPNEKTKVAFVTGTTTEKYIYLLYMGVFSTANRGYKVNASKCIYVYDWSGTPVMKINLDRDIMGFTVSKNDKVIFAFDPDSKNIVKANLPTIQ